MKLSTLRIPAEQYAFATPTSTELPTGTTQRKQREKATTFSVGFAPPSSDHASPNYLLLVSNEAELTLSLEDSVIQLKGFLCSPHVAGIRGKAEALLVTLRQLEELHSLVIHCQATVSVQALYCSPLLIARF